MAESKPKNNASLSQLGNLYQYLIALKLCLESPSGTVINIERFGDLTIEDYNYEIKHHTDPNYTLNDTHIDFWKSISNWVSNRDMLASHSHFVLLTTAIVNKDSSFKAWNESLPEQKLKVVKGIFEKIKKSTHEYKTIRPYLDKVFNYGGEYTEDELLNVLGKVVIKHSFENAEMLYSKLLEHSALIFAKESNRPAFIRSLVGFIVEKGICTPNEWDIEINEFRSFLQEQALKLVNNHVLDFPDLKIDAAIDDATFDKNFIKKIKEIPYPEKINEAAENYTYTQNIMLIMADRNPHALKEFENQVKDAGNQLLSLKEITRLEIENYDDNILIKKSKILYNKASLEIKTGQNTPSMIQKGIMHTHIDNSEFSWKIKEEDLEN